MLVTGALALMLQACVTYQATTHGPIRSAGYYAENEEYQDAYDEYAPDVSVGFADAAYYPWWSVDYYYLGPHYYRPAYWPGPRYSLGYRYGFPPNYWVYYGFYNPFYYPYSTWAWYDPWYGWPRYGIGTNFFWHDVYWATPSANPSHARDRQPVSSDYDGYSVYGDAFDDPRDRGAARPGNRGSLSVTPGTRTGSMQVRNRSDRKIGESRAGSPALSGSPGVVRQTPRSQPRPVVSTPRRAPVSPPATAPRPSSAPSAGAGSKAPSRNPPKRREN